MDILSTAEQDRIFEEVLGVSKPTSSVADELRETSRKNAIDSLYYFTTAVLGWNKLRKTPHKLMCDFAQRIPRKRKVLLVPRDCYKSTITAKSMPLWIIIQPDFCGLPGTEHRILVASHSSKNSAKHVRSMKQQIERNEMFQWLFPELVPDFSKTTWTDTNMLFPRQGMYGEDTIESAGVDTHIVSRHYTVQLYDDLEDMESFESPTVREKVKNWYRAGEALFVDEADAYHLIVGTRWGTDDLYADIQKNESDQYEFLCRPLHWTREDIANDLDDAAKKGYQPIYAMDPEKDAPDPDKTYYFFPELFPPDACKRIKQKQGQWMYSMLYLNNPRDESLAEFKRSWILPLSWTHDSDLIIRNADGTQAIVEWDTLKRVVFWDPAMSEEKQKKGCRNAIVVVARDRKGRLFFLQAFAERRDPTKLCSKYIGFHQRYLCHSAGIEDVGFQRTLKYPLQHLMLEQSYTFPVTPVRPIRSKDTRIRSLIPYFETGYAYVDPRLKDFIEELEGYPNYPTKDLIDAAATCLELLTAPNDQRDDPSRKKAMRQAEEATLTTRDSVTGY